MKDLLGGGVDVSKRSTSIIADICDGDRLEVNDKTEMGEEVELKIVPLVENQRVVHQSWLIAEKMTCLRGRMKLKLETEEMMR